MSQMNIDLEGWNLHRAAMENRADIARALIARGDDIEANIDGETPLNIAIMHDHHDVATLLLEHGADIYPKDDDGGLLAAVSALADVATGGDDASGSGDDDAAKAAEALCNPSLDVARLPFEHVADVNVKSTGLDFSMEIHRALRSQDLVGMERIINEVGPQRAFGSNMTDDFTGRQLMNYFSKYPEGLPGGKIHPEFLTLGLKYSPYVTMGQRLGYLRICEQALDYLASNNHSGLKYRQFAGGFAFSINKARLFALRESIFVRATAEEKILLANDTVQQRIDGPKLDSLGREVSDEKCVGGDYLSIAQFFSYKSLRCGHFLGCRVSISTRPRERDPDEIKENWEVAWKTAMEKCVIVHPEAASPSWQPRMGRCRCEECTTVPLDPS